MADGRFRPQEPHDARADSARRDAAACYGWLPGRVRGFVRGRYDQLLAAEDLEEIAHDAAGAAALGGRDLEHDSDVLRYAQRVARNLVVSALRRRDSRPSLLPPEAMVHRFCDPRSGRLAQRLEACDEIQALLATADRAGRALIVAWLDCLRERPAASHRHVAERLGWSVAKLKRELDRLRSCYDVRRWGESR